MKLIDWATVPIGAKVCNLYYPDLFGEFRNYQANEAGDCVIAVEFEGAQGGIKLEYFSNVPLASREYISQLRLAPADKQHWLVYTDGVTVIPDWAECSYCGLRYFRQDKPFEGVTNSPYDLLYTAQYKLGNDRGLFKDGWTDNPNEAIE